MTTAGTAWTSPPRENTNGDKRLGAKGFKGG
jgi:hypothetical protein